MVKLVMMPPQDELQQQWARRLEQTLPQYQIVVPQTDDEARRFAAHEPLHNIVNKAAWY